ncbi:unannotated protein [freshwater metagenome]|uniref:Unannotated protein n=1 Tax=freshwater metagenome TaxID=449393 RepID=A0A6J7W006_9ZZZZ
MKISLSDGLPLLQSFNLSGIPAPASAVFRRTALRAFFAASRAWAADWAFLIILFASVGFSFNHSARRSFVTFCTNERIDTLPNLALV